MSTAPAMPALSSLPLEDLKQHAAQLGEFSRQIFSNDIHEFRHSQRQSIESLSEVVGRLERLTRNLHEGVAVGGADIEKRREIESLERDHRSFRVKLYLLEAAFEASDLESKENFHRVLDDLRQGLVAEIIEAEARNAPLSEISHLRSSLEGCLMNLADSCRAVLDARLEFVERGKLAVSFSDAVAAFVAGKGPMPTIAL